MLKNANVVPPEVQLLKEIGELEAAVKTGRDWQCAEKLRDKLQEKRVVFALAMERRRRREARTLD